MLSWLIGLVVAFILTLVLRRAFRRGRALGFLPLLVILVLASPMLMAFTPLQEVDADPDFWAVVSQFLTLGGFAAIVAVLINILKAMGVVKDGTAGTWAAGANLIGLGLLYVFQVVSPDLNIGAVDTHLSEIAKILTSIFSYVYTYWVSNRTHNVLAAGKVPLIGTSNTPDFQALEAQYGETGTD